MHGRLAAEASEERRACLPAPDTSPVAIPEPQAPGRRRAKAPGRDSEGAHTPLPTTSVGRERASPAGEQSPKAVRPGTGEETGPRRHPKATQDGAVGGDPIERPRARQAVARDGE